MIERFVSLENSSAEKEICRSRFLTKVFYIENEDEAIKILDALRKEYSDATHICYAYVADPEGNRARFSDDGEPSGTAGLPILDAIRKRGLRRVLIAVVRYYGGIKLGAGPLARAYGDCAAAGLLAAKERVFVFCGVYSLGLDFALYKKAAKAIENVGRMLKTEFGEGVYLETAIPLSVDFDVLVTGLSGGRVKPVKLNEGYIEMCF